MKLLHSFVITLALAGSMLGQSFIPMPVPKMQFLDSSGDPLASGKVYTYISGTTTNQNTYTDSGGGTPNANPVVLDSGGFAEIWLDVTLSYKFKVDSSADVTQYTIDNVTADNIGTSTTVGSGAAEDTKIVFDGNAQDYYVGLDDGTDDLFIGLGSTVGTTPILSMDENLDITLCDATATDCDITFDGNAADFYIGLDDGQDDLMIGVGAVVGTTPAITIDDVTLGVTFAADPVIGGATPALTVGNGTEADTMVWYDGNAQDYYVALDDTADDLLIGLGSTVGTTPSIHIDENQRVLIANAAQTVDATLHIVAEDTVTSALVVEVPSGTGIHAQIWHYAGTDAASIEVDSDETDMVLASRDLGSDVAGPSYEVGHNSNATPNAGTIKFTELDGSNDYVWVDNTGDLRIHTSAPAAAVTDTDGTVVGAQSSPLKDEDGNLLKNLIAEATPEEGLERVLASNYYHYDYVNGRYNSSKFVGPYSEESPWLMFDKERSFSPVIATSYNSLAIQSLNTTINTMKLALILFGVGFVGSTGLLYREMRGKK